MGIEPLRVKYVVTRKPHRCFACLEMFPAGVEMQLSTQVGDGHIYNLYLCEECEEFIIKHHDFCFDPFEFCYHEGCVKEAKVQLAEEGRE